MTERGWSADPNVVLRYRVVRWLADRSREDPGRIPSNEDIAEALGVDMKRVGLVTALLASQGLCWLGSGMSTPSLPVKAEPGLVGLAATWAVARASRRERRVACRDALLDWLYEMPGQVPDAAPFSADPRSSFFGEDFADQEISESLGHLLEIGLTEGISSWGGSVVRPQLTADGRICVERYDASVAAWQSRASTEPTFMISNSHAITIATNSPGAIQTVTITTDARQQMLQAAAALLATLPVLGLDPEDLERANDIAQRLRAEAEQGESDPGRLRAVLKDARTIAVAGTGSAAGVGIVALVQQIGQSLGL